MSPLSIFRSQDNLSPLHVAAGMGHIEVTKRLLDNGAHMEAEDNALYTPLWRAAYYGHPEVVEVRLYLSSRVWSGNLGCVLSLARENGRASLELRLR